MITKDFYIENKGLSISIPENEKNLTFSTNTQSDILKVCGKGKIFVNNKETEDATEIGEAFKLFALNYGKQ
jgi:biopolymer transport protein ExbD